jgi:hypothetical protein
MGDAKHRYDMEEAKHRYPNAAVKKLVLDLFKEGAHHDRITAAHGLQGFAGHGAHTELYQFVAAVTLHVLHEEGHLTRDPQGWYVLAVC